MESLGIDYKLLIAQLINFGLFFIIFKKLIAKPFLEFIHKERKNDEEKEKALLDVKTSQDRLEKQEKEKKVQMMKEMDERTITIKKEVQELREEMLKNAKGEADRVIEQGHKQVEEEHMVMLKDVKNRTGELSIFLIQSALKEYLDEETRKKITQYILANSPKN